MTEEQIRAQYPGVSDDLVKQIIALHEGDPATFSKQYEQGAYLRRFAFGDSARSGFGAIGQALAGAMAKKQEREYADLLRGYNRNVTKAKRNWWESRYPQSVTSLPEGSDYAPTTPEVRGEEY